MMGYPLSFSLLSILRSIQHPWLGTWARTVSWLKLTSNTPSVYVRFIPLIGLFLGYKWLGKYFFDICLPFGSRSSPFIFNTFADAVSWILVQKFYTTALIHYLDDFFVCAPTREEYQSKVDIIINESLSRSVRSTNRFTTTTFGNSLPKLD